MFNFKSLRVGEGRVTTAESLYTRLLHHPPKLLFTLLAEETFLKPLCELQTKLSIYLITGVTNQPPNHPPPPRPICMLYNIPTDTNIYRLITSSGQKYITPVFLFARIIVLL